MCYLLLLVGFTTADDIPYLRGGGHQIIIAHQDHTGTSSEFDAVPKDILPNADHLEETTSLRKLATRYRRQWSPQLASIKEEDAGETNPTGSQNLPYRRDKRHRWQKSSSKPAHPNISNPQAGGNKNDIVATQRIPQRPQRISNGPQIISNGLHRIPQMPKKRVPLFSGDDFNGFGW
jgi:hypothetical protein